MNDLDRLFREYHQPLVRYLTRRLGDRDWAEEVAQETFLRAARQETIVSERSWLFAVATNLVRDEARKDARRRRHLELLREQAKVDNIVEPEPLTIERAEEAALARRALDMLNERDREALLMREEGLDYGEIAAALELSTASVGTTLSRARRRLVEAYETLQARPTGMGHMQHLDEGTIHAWLDDALPADERERVAKHAAECETCAAAVAEARGLIAGASRIVGALDVVRGNVMPTPVPLTTQGKGAGSSLWKKLHFTPARAAIAATLLVAAGSMLTLRHQPDVIQPSIGFSTRPVAPRVAPQTVSPAAKPPVAAPKRAAETRDLQKPGTPELPAMKVAEPIVPRADSAPRPAAPVAAPANIDGADLKTTMRSNAAVAAAGDAPKAAGAPAIGFGTAARMSFAPTAEAHTNPEGCYRVSPDSVSWLRELPRTFALGRDSTTGVSVVRAMSQAGQVDSVLVGSTWRKLGNATQVSLRGPTNLVSLRFADTEVRAQASSSNRSADVEIARIACRQ